MEMYSLDWYKEQFAEFLKLSTEEDYDYDTEDVETAVIIFPAYLMGKFNLRLDSIFDNGYIEILKKDNYILNSVQADTKQNYEHQYLAILERLYNKALSVDPTQDRTGTGRIREFGLQIEHDMSLGFPVLTTKKVNWQAAVKETQWFLSGSTNINDLDSKIWDEWATEDGSIGQMYGQQWRGIDKRGLQRTPDQIAIAIDTIKNNPSSSRIVVDSWVPALIPLDGQTPQESVLQERMALAPCHCLFQFFVDGDNLSLKMYQRSADIFLGVPFNAIGYAYLLMWVASITGKKPDKFIHTFGDVHLYANHIEQAKEQLSRSIGVAPMAELKENGRKVKGFFANDIELISYAPHPAIKAEVSV